MSESDGRKFEVEITRDVDLSDDNDGAKRPLGDEGDKPASAHEHEGNGVDQVEGPEQQPIGLVVQPLFPAASLATGLWMLWAARIATLVALIGVAITGVELFTHFDSGITSPAVTFTVLGAGLFCLVVGVALTRAEAVKVVTKPGAGIMTVGVDLSGDSLPKVVQQVGGALKNLTANRVLLIVGLFLMVVAVWSGRPGGTPNSTPSPSPSPSVANSGS